MPPSKFPSPIRWFVQRRDMGTGEVIHHMHPTHNPSLHLMADSLPSIAILSKGAFLFSQATLPLLLPSSDSTSTADLLHPPTLIFTGATASVKGSPLFASFATMKFALRALAQSLAREFGPKGVHVAHAIIDGVIDIPRTQAYGFAKEAMIDPNAVSFLVFVP